MRFSPACAVPWPCRLDLADRRSSASAPTTRSRRSRSSLLKQGETLLAPGKYIEADDALETALVVDPRNRAAFTAMARVAIKQKLYGQAIRLTNKALALEPTDRDALAVQGEAMVELGAVPRAKENLAKLQKLCGTAGCPQVAALSRGDRRGPGAGRGQGPRQSRRRTRLRDRIRARARRIRRR